MMSFRLNLAAGLLPLVALVCGDVAAAQTIEYVHVDVQGSLIAITTPDRVVTQRREYEPYGFELTGLAGNGPSYTGHTHDAATGLTYMQQRYYDPLIGRFLSVDPIAVNASLGDNFNRYWYGDNNPYTLIDPDGRATCANADCSKSRIEAEPARRGQPPTVNGNEGLLAGDPVADEVAVGNQRGPLISFRNDVSGAPTPPAVVSTPTAEMIERAVVEADVESVNINSTTGGSHGPNSRHYQGRAVDINRINGHRIDSAEGRAAVGPLQGRFDGQRNIRENFGPVRNEKKNSSGATATQMPGMAAAHQNHIHVSGQQ